MRLVGTDGLDQRGFPELEILCDSLQITIFQDSLCLISRCLCQHPLRDDTCQMGGKHVGCEGQRGRHELAVDEEVGNLGMIDKCGPDENDDLKFDHALA